MRESDWSSDVCSSDLFPSHDTTLNKLNLPSSSPFCRDAGPCVQPASNFPLPFASRTSPRPNEAEEESEGRQAWKQRIKSFSPVRGTESFLPPRTQRPQRFFILNPNLRWGGVDDPACVECHKPESFNAGTLIEGALPGLSTSVHVHLHVHETPVGPRNQGFQAVIPISQTSGFFPSSSPPRGVAGPQIW